MAFHLKLQRIAVKSPAFLALTLLCGSVAAAQVQFRTLDKEVIETRLKAFSKRNDERETTLKGLFIASGCTGDKLSEQPLKGKLPPNLICVLPGQSDAEIVVGAHTDHADVGDGVVDNWSGAALLPSLYFSISAVPRRHTYVFVGFTGEERGMVGSDFYVHHLSREQRSKIDGMVNLDTLGVGPTKVWATHADKTLLTALASTAEAMHLSIGMMNVERVGTTDSESFAQFKIPRITIHSITQETWPILHSKKENLSAIRLDDYYASYRLLAAYLAYLDTDLGQPEAAPQKNSH